MSQAGTGMPVSRPRSCRQSPLPPMWIRKISLYAHERWHHTSTDLFHTPPDTLSLPEANDYAPSPLEIAQKMKFNLHPIVLALRRAVVNVLAPMMRRCKPDTNILIASAYNNPQTGLPSQGKISALSTLARIYVAAVQVREGKKKEDLWRIRDTNLQEPIILF